MLIGFTEGLQWAPVMQWVAKTCRLPVSGWTGPLWKPMETSDGAIPTFFVAIAKKSAPQKETTLALMPWSGVLQSASLKTHLRTPPRAANSVGLESCRLPLSLTHLSPFLVFESCRLPTYSHTFALVGHIPDPSPHLVASNSVFESCRLPTYSHTFALVGHIPDPSPHLVASNSVLESCRLPTYSDTVAL